MRSKRLIDAAYAADKADQRGTERVSEVLTIEKRSTIEVLYTNDQKNDSLLTRYL